MERLTRRGFRGLTRIERLTRRGFRRLARIERLTRGGFSRTGADGAPHETRISRTDADRAPDETPTFADDRGSEGAPRLRPLASRRRAHDRWNSITPDWRLAEV